MPRRQFPYFRRDFQNLAAKANRQGLNQFFPTRNSGKWAGFGYGTPLHVWQFDQSGSPIRSDGSPQRVFSFSGSNPLFQRVVPEIVENSESIPQKAVEVFTAGDKFVYGDATWPPLTSEFLFLFLVRFSNICFEKDAWIFKKVGDPGGGNTGVEIGLDGSANELLCRLYKNGATKTAVLDFTPFMGTWCIIGAGLYSTKEPTLYINKDEDAIGSALASLDISNPGTAELMGLNNSQNVSAQIAGMAYWEGVDAAKIQDEYSEFIDSFFQLGQIDGFQMVDDTIAGVVSYFGDYLSVYGPNQCRLSENGLVVYESVENEFTYSEDLTQSDWTKENALCSIEDRITPQGMRGAIKLLEQTAVSPIITDIFRSGFTVAINTDLSSVTPEVGQSFILTALQVNSGDLQAKVTDDLKPKIGVISGGCLYDCDIVGSWGSDNWVEILMINGDTLDDSNTLALCFEDDQNLYVLRFNETSCQIFKRSGSTTWTAIGSDAGGLTNGDLVAFERDGNNLKVYVNHEVLISQTDSDHTSGDPGVGMGSLSAHVPYSTDDLAEQVLDYIRAGTGSYLSGTAMLDTFTESSDTDLNSHIPDIGQQWTLEKQITAGVLEIDSANNRLRPKATVSSDGCLYSTSRSPAIGSPDYRVEVHATNAGGGDDYFYVVARLQDQNNFYALEFNNTAARLYKVVAGAWTQIGIQFNVINGDMLGVECEGTTIKGMMNGSVMTSGTDSNHTTEGKQGLGAGALRVALSDMDILDYMDSFRVIKL